MFSMNFERDKSRTLDSRTFTECSKLMQDLSAPPLPTRSQSIEPFYNSDQMQVSEDKSIVLNMSLMNPPRITVKGPTPTPPPRRRKEMNPQVSTSSTTLTIPNTKSQEGQEEDATTTSQSDKKTTPGPGGTVPNTQCTRNPEVSDNDAMKAQSNFLQPPCPSIMMGNNNNNNVEAKSNKSPTEKKKRMHKGQGLLRRPLQLFVNWMTGIASNMEYQACPPL